MGHSPCRAQLSCLGCGAFVLLLLLLSPEPPQPGPRHQGQHQQGRLLPTRGSGEAASAPSPPLWDTGAGDSCPRDKMLGNAGGGSRRCSLPGHRAPNSSFFPYFCTHRILPAPFAPLLQLSPHAAAELPGKGKEQLYKSSESLSQPGRILLSSKEIKLNQETSRTTEGELLRAQPRQAGGSLPRDCQTFFLHFLINKAKQLQ